MLHPLDASLNLGGRKCVEGVVFQNHEEHLDRCIVAHPVRVGNDHWIGDGFAGLLQEALRWAVGYNIDHDNQCETGLMNPPFAVGHNLDLPLHGLVLAQSDSDVAGCSHLVVDHEAEYRQCAQPAGQSLSFLPMTLHGGVDRQSLDQAASEDLLGHFDPVHVLRNVADPVQVQLNHGVRFPVELEHKQMADL